MHAPTLLPKPAHAHGWKHRTALVIDSHVAGESEMILNTALLVRFLETIDQALAATTRRIQIIDPATASPTTLSSWAELSAFYGRVTKEHQDLPESVEWRTGDVLIAGGFPEKWYAVGGPALYHDSFTFSVYSTRDVFAAINAATADICAATHATLLGVHEGKLIA